MFSYFHEKFSFLTYCLDPEPDLHLLSQLNPDCDPHSHKNLDSKHGRHLGNTVRIRTLLNYDIYSMLYYCTTRKLTAKPPPHSHTRELVFMRFPLSVMQVCVEFIENNRQK
jgi:hypothetical protein